MSDELMKYVTKYIMEDDEMPIPSLLSAILCAHWPRQLAKAFDNINPILYTIVCLIKGWIEVVREDTEVSKPKIKFQIIFSIFPEILQRREEAKVPSSS